MRRIRQTPESTRLLRRRLDFFFLPHFAGRHRNVGEEENTPDQWSLSLEVQQRGVGGTRTGYTYYVVRRDALTGRFRPRVFGNVHSAVPAVYGVYALHFFRR